MGKDFIGKELSEEDNAIEFAVSHLIASDKEREIKNGLREGLEAYAIANGRVPNITDSAIDNLYSLYLKKNSLKQLNPETLRNIPVQIPAKPDASYSRIEEICKSAQIVPKDYDDQLKNLDKVLTNELAKYGFSSQFSPRSNPYYIKKDESSGTSTLIFPKGLAPLSYTKHLLEGTYVVKTNSETELDDLIISENRSKFSSTLNIIGSTSAAGLITEMSYKMFSNQSSNNAEIMLATLVLGLPAGLLCSIGIGMLVDYIMSYTKAKKSLEKIKPYIQPELSSNLQYDFDIIRKALE